MAMIGAKNKFFLTINQKTPPLKLLLLCVIANMEAICQQSVDVITHSEYLFLFQLKLMLICFGGKDFLQHNDTDNSI